MALSHLAGLGQQRTSPNIQILCPTGGKITSPSNLGDGLHTGTYLQQKWAGCHEQGTNIKRVNQPYVTE